MSQQFSKKLVQSSESKLTNTAKRSVTTTVVSSSSDHSWSNKMSFASPEADFTSTNVAKDDTEPTSYNDTWSHTMSFTSPDSDFCSTATTDSDDPQVHDILLKNTTADANWSDALSFSSPESDFTAMSPLSQKVETMKAKNEFMQHLQKNGHKHNDMAYSLSQAQTEGDFSSPQFMNLLNDQMKKQLGNVNARDISPLKTQDGSLHIKPLTPPGFDDSPKEDQRVFQDIPLPHTMQEATQPNDPRAIVVTEADMPFKIVSVNASWEQLCGYTEEESRGKTLGLLQGPETNHSAVTALMSQLLKGEEAGTMLTNYDKSGRKFHNRLTVGPLKNNHGAITHFVGVLKEVNEMGEHFDEEVHDKSMIYSSSTL